MEHPFWRTKFTITDADDLRQVIASGIKEVWIDVAKGDDVVASVTLEEVDAEVEQVLSGVAEQTAVTRKASFADEAKRAAKICTQGKEAMVSMFQEVRMGKAIAA